MSATAAVTTYEDTSIFRPALLLACGRALAFAATFFIPVVLVRVFSPADFGTYKQLFLIHSTAFVIVQFGMTNSLYYFLPLGPGHAGRYAANSMLFVGFAGLCSMGALLLQAPRISQWMKNSELSAHLFWIGLYLFWTVTSSALEIVMIARGRYVWASASYALSDMARAVALILPALSSHRLEWIVRGAAVVALLRTVAALYYYRREFGATFRPDAALMKRQLAYALPFGIAILFEILQANLPHYAVSHQFDPTTFAIYAIGCLQVPLVDFVASPATDLMMVRMQESLAIGRAGPAAEVWCDTTRKLALVFFPLVGFLVLAGREIITTLFTENYLASVPVFVAWSTLILFAVFPVDAALRVYAQTRLLLAINVARLAIIAALITQFIFAFHLIGPVLVTILATGVAKAAGLVRISKLMGLRLSQVLPWRNLGAVLAAAGGAAVVSLVVKSRIAGPPFVVLLQLAAVYGVLYLVLAGLLDALSQEERQASREWLRKAAVTVRAWGGWGA